MRIKYLAIMGVLLLGSFIIFSCTDNAEEDDTMQMMGNRGLMMEGRYHMMGMNHMGMLMDSTIDMNNMMMDQMDQWDYEQMMGGQMGMNSMMGMTQNIQGMAQQMKMMSRNMQTMMDDQDIKSNEQLSEHIEQMQEMMSQTAKKLKDMTELNQKIMEDMQK